MTSSWRNSNLLFWLLIPLGGLFILTVLAMVATLFSDPRTPAARFFERYGEGLVASETLLVLVTGLLAIVLDRCRTLRYQHSDRQPIDYTTGNESP